MWHRNVRLKYLDVDKSFHLVFPSPSWKGSLVHLARFIREGRALVMLEVMATHHFQRVLAVWKCNDQQNAAEYIYKQV